MQTRRIGVIAALIVAASFLGAPVRRADGDAKGRAKAEQLVKEGDAQLLLGDLQSAKGLYTQAREADATYATAVIRLAFVEHRLGNGDEAVKLLEEVTAGSGAPAEAWQILAGILGERREWKKAAAAYEAYLKLEPNDYQTRLAMARVYRTMGEEGDKAAKMRALAEYERVVRDAKNDSAIRNLAQEEALAVKYGDAGRAYMEGRSAYVNGDYRGAVTKLEKLTKEHPEVEEAHYMLGLAYITPEINRRPDALKSWDRATKIKEAWLHLGIEFHDDGDLATAETKLKGAIDLDRQYQEAWYHLGVVYAEKADYDAAVKAWETAYTIDPESEFGKWAATKYSMLTAQGASSGVFQEGQVIDPASETAMGHKFEEMALDYFGGLIDDPKLVARMDKIWTRLTAVSDRGDIPYKLYLVNSPEVNAFSAPGGRVFMTKGLIDAIKTRMGDKNEYFAAVLGHELAHSTLRHMPEKWKYVQTVINDPRTTREDLEKAMTQVMTGMTRQSEYEADQYGALYMYRAGYNPRYAIDLHVQFAKVFGEIPDGLDHPTFADRSARVKDFLIELRGRVREFERGNEAFKKGDYAGAARHYEVFLAVLPRNAPAHMNLALAWHRQALTRVGTDQKYKRATDLDPDARAAAIELHSGAGEQKPDPRIDQALMRQAAAEYKTALRIDPSYTLARVNYGALLLDMGQVKVATKILEAAVKKSPDNAQAWNNLGIAYAMGKNQKKAIAALEKATQLNAKLSDPWFNLGVVYADAGQNQKAMDAFEAYAKLDPDSGWAKKARAKKAELAQAAPAPAPAKKKPR